MSYSTINSLSTVKRRIKCNMAHKCSILQNLVKSSFSELIPTISDEDRKRKHSKITNNILFYMKIYTNLRYNIIVKKAVILKYLMCRLLINSKVKANKIFSVTVSFFVYSPENKNIFYKCKIMISLTIFLILICSGIEPNPGPQRNVEIITYNCNGLGDQNKLRRLLSKSNKKVQNGAIIFLQETHIVNTEAIKSTWKNKFVSNCKKTNSAGVIILFNNKYNVDYCYEDLEGRAIVISLSNEDN